MIGRERRDAIATVLQRIPSTCPADLHDWIVSGHTLIEDDCGVMAAHPVPPTSGGAQCALDAVVHRHGCCWCGKFRTGREMKP
jgi:hypothetical protein